jgi:ABC-type multidrug transport system fused ATPase/permease subunit
MKISKMARQAEHHFLKHFASMQGLMVESLTNVKQVKSLNLEQQQELMFAKLGRQIISFRCRATLLKSMVSPVTEITVGIALALMILMAFWQISRNTSSYAAVMGCLAAAYALKKPVRAMANSIVQLQKSIASVQRILWIYHQQKTQIEHFYSDYDPPLRTLVLENVSFSYDGRHAVLENISAKFERGERIAIFGPSGVGKTSLVDLIIGFYPCSKGLILANNLDLKNIDPQIWRQEISVVTQTPFLFDTTIKENVRYGFLQANEKQILHALHLAGADEIITRLPDGLNTVVGERGCRLSGGERKRIALARALVRPISILILDEATSELDMSAEKALLSAIDKISDNLLILNISHRPGILYHCDRAILLDKGRAKEICPKQQLLALTQEKYENNPLFGDKTADKNDLSRETQFGQIR